MDDAKDLVDYLLHAAARDLAKGGAGCRSTGEVAAQMGRTTDAARRLLTSLEAAGRVECVGTIEGLGDVLQWRVSAPSTPLAA